ncbi:Predicted nucleotidyltransferase [Paraburkholderia unamae]|uniref:nucleotidyl transferase AbiEii/AbiGii toxin family protein n=1 Tax=Paraburkholderia unamae TaxID=219649 RepID=UPI001CB2B619|nr:nucleotidyl transferase AbiEii/AbiGii toxin family protein [Paraburkholderia unamae]CAG9274867.1 Predicted nucleotidyltransferase [Paraburkholderia unamae]
MTASSQTPVVKVPADRPVPALTIALLSAVKDACGQLGAHFVLAGATARDIQFWHLRGIKSPIATRDVDVAVCALSWEFHQTLIDRLLASGHFTRDAKAQQKLIFQRETDAFGVQLDLVPFGPVEAQPGTIAWPPDGDIVMTVLGFQEAVDTAEQIDIGEGQVVPVVTIPAFVLLKLMAWQDRRTSTSTDASDILFVLRKFFFAGNTNRVYDEAMDLLEASEFKAETAAAGLLGRDARDVARPATRAAVRALLRSRTTYATLQSDLLARAATLMLGEFVDDSDDLLAAFTAQFVADPPASGLADDDGG